MKSKTFLLIVTFASLSYQAHSQQTFQKTFDYFSDLMRFNSIVALPTGEFIVAGGSIATNNNRDAWIVKFDANGDTLWTSSFGDSIGTSNSSRFNGLSLTPNGGYFAAGFSAGFGNGFDYYLVKTDSNGDSLWTRSINDPMNSVDYCHATLFSSDGYLMTFGYRGGFEGDFYLSKNDTSGNIVWTKGYSIPGDHDFGYSIAQSNDFGYLLSGSTESTTNTNILLIKTDSAGNVVWSKTYGGLGVDESHKVIITQDDNIIVGGTTESFGAGYKDILLIKIDNLGDTLWTKTYGTSALDQLYSVAETQDNGFIITGASYNSTVGKTQLVLIKADSIGNLIWSKHYGNNSYNIEGRDVAITTDGGFVVCGNLNGAGYIIKTDASGVSGCNEMIYLLNQNFAPLNANPVTINVASGSILRKPPSTIVRGGQITNFCFTTNVTENISNQEFNIFPNLVQDIITMNINSENPIDILIELFDSEGRKIRMLYEGSVNNKSFSTTFNSTNISPGIYFIKCSKGLNSVKRFVKY